MLQKQKETVLALLKYAETNKDYRNRYWFPYKDFLDPADSFTSFSCESLDGKQGYIALVENLLIADATAKIFVEVYGFEEDGNGPFIYADTLVIFSKLPFSEIKQIFSKPKDIFPDGIGEVNGLQHQFIINDTGGLIPATNLPNNGYSIYYCWWD